MIRLYVILLIGCFASGTNCQTINVSYGGSFSGLGDLQGRYMSVGYMHILSKRISFYGSYQSSSMAGNKVSYYYAGRPFLGIDFTSESIIDINDIFNNVELINERLHDIGSSISYDPPYAMINEEHIDLGIHLTVFANEKFSYYIEGNLSLVKMEMTVPSTFLDVYINNESWINDPEIFTGPRVLRRVGLITSFQDHFLDFGLGYGVGVDYQLRNYLSIGANGHYNQYQNDAQNFITWGFRVGLKI